MTTFFRLACTAAILLSLPKAAAAQESSRGCPIPRHVSHPAVRDSILRSLEADERALTGLVRDEGTGKPVPGIVVAIEGTDRVTMTGADGGYVLRFLERIELRPRPLMARACELGWDYLTDVREVSLVTPWGDARVVRDGVALPGRPYAVRLDFRIRRRPTEF